MHEEDEILCLAVLEFIYILYNATCYPCFITAQVSSRRFTPLAGSQSSK